MYVYLHNHINTEMNGMTGGISNKNGLEQDRIIYNSVDDIPANARFHFDYRLTALTVEWAPKSRI